jgi:amino acid transporter
VAGLGLMGTYVFYGLVTSSAAGIFGAAFLDDIGIWNNQPWWSGFLVGAVALALALWLTIVPARRATSVLLSVEGITVLLILVIAVVVLVRLLAGNAPDDASFTMNVFTVPKGTDSSTLFLGIIFGLLSFAGFEAAATLGEEAHEPRRDIPRAILGTAIFGGVYFTFVTAVETMAFSTGKGMDAFVSSPALMGDLGSSYIGTWVGDLITLGASVSAFACCLACVVGASRLLFAFVRDLSPSHSVATTGRNGTPVAAALVITAVIAVIALICAVFFAAKPFDTFLWSGTIGTLILLVAYVLATIGCIKLIWVDKKMSVPTWEVVIPVLALLMLGYTIYRNVFPYPTEGPARWFPVVAFGWLVLVTVVMLAAPGVARRLAAGLSELDETPTSSKEPV